ncbi:phage tail protein [Arenicella xantha]|uniref:Microcystin-dependent protein n=1 Tax=Arenicella xantha TaxID=644221 RepID=A0A395JJJ4_9GAMM|nr:tail fiber protein [Arenicella xantha]RBP49929.1 microcystin-dependent protein [Arenicella xantha]
MSSNPFIGEIMPVGFNFAPRGWSLCDGQLLAISSNTALFSLLGTKFGGDGRTTFGLPDLRGRVMKGVGSGPGLQTVVWGQKGGHESVTLTVQNLPSHNHTVILHGETAPATLNNPLGNMLASHTGYAAPVPAENKAMAAESITCANSGSGLPVDIKNPYLGIYMCIAMLGLYPSRS